MIVWENSKVIPCVDRSGDPLSVIEQSRKDRVTATLRMNGHADKAKRYVLGNGTLVEPLDRQRFVLPATDEIVTRI